MRSPVVSGGFSRWQTSVRATWAFPAPTPIFRRTTTRPEPYPPLRSRPVTRATTLVDWKTPAIRAVLRAGTSGKENISGKIMQLHHDKHHQAYVTGANTALTQLAAARDNGDFANINKLEKDLAFNLAGHVNHTIFWTNLSPDGGDKPTGELASAIDDNFGSFDKFVAHFTAASAGIQGSGWGALVWDSLGQKL